MTQNTENHTPIRRFRAPDEVWNPFMAACRVEGSNASSILRHLIDAYMEEKEGPREDDTEND